MPYVQRGEDNNISWMYLTFREGYAEEFLPDDDPEVLTFILSMRPSPYTLFLHVIWSRMTDAEAELVQQSLDLLPIRAQNVIAASDAPSSDSEAFGLLRTAIEGSTSAARADEIMAWVFVIL